MAPRAPEKPSLSSCWARFRSAPAFALLALPVLMFGAVDCYSTGDGTAPPLKDLYYPVGLRVSAGGTVLYAVNADFDLQYNGGTLQSYDLGAIRRDTVKLLANPRNPDPAIPIIDRSQLGQNPCPARSPAVDPQVPLGQTCAPPVRSSDYVRDSAVIGAFATDLLLSDPPTVLAGAATEVAGTRGYDRLFAAVRGNASVTWASVQRDVPLVGDPNDPAYGPYVINCGKDGAGRCDGNHQAGSNPDEAGNVRHVTMPGEPFGMAISEDGQSLVVTHQNETKTSLFDTGLKRTDVTTSAVDVSPSPALKFVLDGVPFGGIGIAAIPHDRAAFPAAASGASTFPREAFLQTSRALAQVSLIRQYPDEFNGVPPGDAPAQGGRPFLNIEGGFPLTVSPPFGGTDSRGIVIDKTPRLACQAKVALKPVDPSKGRTQAAFDAEQQACARKPARVFIANRSPASLLLGELGGSSTTENNFDPDRLVLTSTLPLSAGPSRLYLAPVVESDGALALRVFIVCFDSATLFVYNPDTQQIENVIRVGLGPFAMAFDPFTFEDVATNKKVDVQVFDQSTSIRRFRFAYLASFTNSFIQVIDLDNKDRSPTFERVVFTLGQPTTPKGS